MGCARPAGRQARAWRLVGGAFDLSDVALNQVAGVVVPDGDAEVLLLTITLDTLAISNRRVSTGKPFSVIPERAKGKTAGISGVSMRSSPITSYLMVEIRSFRHAPPRRRQRSAAAPQCAERRLTSARNMCPTSNWSSDTVSDHPPIRTAEPCWCRPFDDGSPPILGLGLRETENPRDERRHRWLDSSQSTT